MQIQGYRAAGDRCILDFGSSRIIGVSREQVIAILETLGFREIHTDIIGIAREQCGNIYKRSARISDAPQFFDCSTFTKWLYAFRGIWLPRYAVYQREFGVQVELDNLKAGDLIFTKGRSPYFISKRRCGSRGDRNRRRDNCSR